MRKLSLVLSIGFYLLAMLVLQACSQDSRGTDISRMNASQAYQTVNARLTEVSTLTPVLSPQITQTASTATDAPTSHSSPSALPSLTPPSASVTPTATPACDRAAAGIPIDLTVPDDAVMEPGQSFTKIWRLQNSGICTWRAGYSARFFYGAQMSAPDSVPLPQDVHSGQTVEISIDMIAPNSPGTYQGNWKLSNVSGQLFGIGPNGNAPFWVRIVVKEPPSPTPSPTSTSTQTPTPTLPPTATVTPTPTPEIKISGSATLVPTNTIDLDTGTTGDTGDLAYQVDANSFHVLIPQATALLGVYGLSEPSPSACQAAGMSNAPIAIESLSVQTTLCYQTDQGLVGWLRYESLDSATGSLVVHYHTWATVTR